MKTHVLTFAKQFMKGHPKEDEPTDFVNRIKAGIKIHTIRSNYDYWAPKIEEVRIGDAILSLRTWKGKPYNSKQQEFMQITDDYNPGYQKVHIDSIGNAFVRPHLSIGKSKNRLKEIATYDGLTPTDFLDWFNDKIPFNGIIIHFTDFRYR